MTIVAFTGPRPGRQGLGYGKTPLAQAVVGAMRERLVELAPTKTISGMALNVDQWGAWLSVKIGVPFVAACPFSGFDEAWPMEQRAKFHKLLSLAAEIVYVSRPTTQQLKTFGYVGKLMQRRNKWMVDHCDVLLAVWDGSPGGTANCVLYAEKVGRRVERIDPRGLRVAT